MIFKFEIKDAVCQTYSPRPLQLDFEKKVSMNLFQICGTVCQKCVSPVTLIELMPCHLQWVDSPKKQLGDATWKGDNSSNSNTVDGFSKTFFIKAIGGMLRGRVTSFHKTIQSSGKDFVHGFIT